MKIEIEETEIPPAGPHVFVTISGVPTLPGPCKGAFNSLDEALAHVFRRTVEFGHEIYVKEG